MPKKTETRPTTAHINPFGLRMQPELRERLESAATRNGRSLNAEIVERLEQSFGSIDEFILRNRIAELDALGRTIDQAIRNRDELKAEMERARGPGTTERRRELLALVNREDKAVRELEHYWHLLDSDVNSIRSGTLLTGATRSKPPGSGD